MEGFGCKGDKGAVIAPPKKIKKIINLNNQKERKNKNVGTYRL